MWFLYVNKRFYTEVKGIHGIRGHISEIGRGQSEDMLKLIVEELLQGGIVTLNGKTVKLEKIVC